MHKSPISIVFVLLCLLLPACHCAWIHFVEYRDSGCSQAGWNRYVSLPLPSSDCIPPSETPLCMPDGVTCYDSIAGLLNQCLPGAQETYHQIFCSPSSSPFPQYGALIVTARIFNGSTLAPNGTLLCINDTGKILGFRHRSGYLNGIQGRYFNLNCSSPTAIDYGFNCNRFGVNCNVASIIPRESCVSSPVVDAAYWSCGPIDSDTPGHIVEPPPPPPIIQPTAESINIWLTWVSPCSSGPSMYPLWVHDPPRCLQQYSHWHGTEIFYYFSKDLNAGWRCTDAHCRVCWAEVELERSYYARCIDLDEWHGISRFENVLLYLEYDTSAQVAQPPHSSPEIVPDSSCLTGAPISGAICSEGTWYVETSSLSQPGQVIVIGEPLRIVGNLSDLSPQTTFEVKYGPNMPSDRTAIQVDGCVSLTGELVVRINESSEPAAQISIMSYDSYCNDEVTTFNNVTIDLGCRTAAKQTLIYSSRSFNLALGHLDLSQCQKQAEIPSESISAGATTGIAFGVLAALVAVACITIYLLRDRIVPSWRSNRYFDKQQKKHEEQKAAAKHDSDARSAELSKRPSTEGSV